MVCLFNNILPFPESSEYIYHCQLLLHSHLLSVNFLAYLYIIYPEMMLLPQNLPPYIFFSYAFLNLQFLNRLDIKYIPIFYFFVLKYNLFELKYNYIIISSLYSPQSFYVWPLWSILKPWPFLLLVCFVCLFLF